MSDFDAVLERLLDDHAFRAALATDPQAALAGYQLEPEERELLQAQVVSGQGEDRTVELRTSKSGVFGLVGPVVAALGVAEAGQGAAPVPSGLAPGLVGQQVLGNAPPPSQVIGGVPSVETLGVVPDAPQETLGHVPGPVETFGVTGESFGVVPTDVEAVGYHTHVDADGDGSWDQYTAYERADGGVDVRVDLDGDGRADFVGHDLNRDGLVDVAEFDNDGDGTLETRMYDDTGDGWMDRAEPVAHPDEAPRS